MSPSRQTGFSSSLTGELITLAHDMILAGAVIVIASQATQSIERHNR
jgi:hypothetical protein